MSCGCKDEVRALLAKRDVRADARAEFVRQAREAVERGDPDEMKALAERFGHTRYSLVAGEALDILTAALA